MANEFIIKNGLIIQGGTTTITGSLTVSGSITGSGVISGSITNAISASYAVTSSFSSFSQTSSLAINANNIFVKATESAGVHYIHFGLSTLGYDAVLVDNGISYEPDKNQLSTGTVVANNFVGTASWAQSASNALLAQTASFLSIGTYNITASWANSASVAISSSYALSSSFATNALTASFLPSGNYNITASWAQSSSQALTASYTPNALITASVSSNTLTFTKGNGTTFNLTVATGSGGGSTPPGGSDTQIQYNSGSTFAGSSDFTYNYQSQSLQQGFFVSAIGTYSHAEGFNTQAVGQSSHAEGTGTVASGSYSHAEGYNTNATGIYSHAEGTSTIAAGLSSHAEGIVTTTYRTTPTAVSSSENLYAYNTGSGLLVGDSGYASTGQSLYVLWEDGDVNQVWLSNVNGVYNADPNGSGTRVIFSISEFDSQGPSTNVTAGGSVYDFETAANTWGLTPYNYGKFDYDNNLIEVYNVDLTLEASPNGVLVTVPNSGSYAYDVSSITYSSNTSSITIGGTDQFGGPNNGAPDLFGAIITSGKVFLTNITGVTWSPEGSLINSLIGVDSYYNFTSKTFKLAGGIGFAIKPNTIAVINGNDRLLTGANFDGTYSYITTSAQLDPIYGVANIPLIEFGNGSHTGGGNTIAYGNYQTVVGRYNTNSNYRDLFVVGGGDSNTRKDVLAVSTEGVVITGSLIVTGSNTFINYGPAIFSGSVTTVGSTGIATLDFGSAPGTNTATTTVSSSIVNNNSSINIYIMNTSSIDHNVADHQVFSLYSKVAPANIVDNASFDITCITDLRINGQFKVKYNIIN